MAIPLIGITANTIAATANRTTQYELAETYVQSVLRAGGAPVIIPPILTGDALSALFEKLDGVLFSGGSDIDPNLFAGEPHARVYGIDPARDEQEIQLIRRAAEDGKPFMGICRGIQAINVALGGTLFTDIQDQFSGSLRHDCYPDLPRDYLAHQVRVTPGSTLSRILNQEDPRVNSLHHQGIQKLAPALRAMAYAPDGIIESVELPNHPFGIGVQWHPECLPNREEQRALFRAFIMAASRN